jgi:hypothetical protein
MSRYDHQQWTAKTLPLRRVALPAVQNHGLLAFARACGQHHRARDALAPLPPLRELPLAGTHVKLEVAGHAGIAHPQR